MCGIFQCGNLPVFRGVFFKINISTYFSVHPNLVKPVNGIYVSRLYTTVFLPEIMLFVYCYVCFVFFWIFWVFYHTQTQYSRGDTLCVAEEHV